MPSAPPDEPSPITIQINGLLSRDITARFCAIASLIPRSSESIPGYAPGGSISVITGILKRSAISIRRIALR